MSNINEINQRYEELAKDRVYPFISKNRVTILAEGFYQKKEAEYRGVSMIYDRKNQKQKAILIGYFHVPENIIVIPDGLVINDSKRKLVSDKLKQGFKIVSGFPSLHPYEFGEDTEEYKIAKENNEQYNLLVK